MQRIEAGMNKVKLPRRLCLCWGFRRRIYRARILAWYQGNWRPSERMGSLSSLIGAAVFPVGLILVVLAGAELITGNMMSVAMALFSRKYQLKNWRLTGNRHDYEPNRRIVCCLLFGHLVGLTETGPYLEKTIAVAQGKLDMSFGKVLISGIGCNWLVSCCLAFFRRSRRSRKILASGSWLWHLWQSDFSTLSPTCLWFLRHFAGSFTWGQFIGNIIPAFIGNVIGGAVFVGLIYFIAYHKKERSRKEMKQVSWTKGKSTRWFA